MDDFFIAMFMLILIFSYLAFTGLMIWVLYLVSNYTDKEVEEEEEEYTHYKG